jgi:hypothetical protein
MNQEVTMSENESLLIGVVCQLQYRIAKLEKYSDEDARKIAKRLSMILIAQTNGIDPEVLFSRESLNSEGSQASLERLSQNLNMMIENVSRLYEGLDNSI